MREIRVGIVGYGTVGRGAAEAIHAHRAEIEARVGVGLRVSAVCRRSPVPAADVPQGARVMRDWKDLISAPDVDVVVETMGGTTVAFDVVRSALERGKPVVTANKNLLAERGD